MEWLSFSPCLNIQKYVLIINYVVQKIQNQSRLTVNFLYSQLFVEHQSQKKHCMTCSVRLEKLSSLQTRRVNLGGFQIKIDCRHLFDLACLCLSAALKTFCANVKKSCLASVQHYATSKVYQLDFKSPDFWSGAKIVKNNRKFEKSCLTYLELGVAIVTDNRLLA